MLISGCIFIFALEFTYHTLCCFWCCLVVKSCPTFATPWAVAHQALLSMEFPRQKYWTGLPFIFPGDLPDPEIKSEFFCIGWWILYHWTTREAHTFCISCTFYVNLPFIFHITSENSTPHSLKKMPVKQKSTKSWYCYENSCDIPEPLKWSQTMLYR